MRAFLRCACWLASVMVAIVIAIPAYAQALSVEPLFIEIAPGQSAAVRVRNNSESRQTVEVSVVERAIAENGEATRTDAEDEFILFPPQAVLEPNSVQVFRIQPITPDMERSHSYYVTVRQLPVALTEASEGARIQVVFAFDIAVHVVPRGAEAEAELVSSRLTTTTISTVDPDDPNRSPDPAVQAQEPRREVQGVEITLRNTGNKYLYLQNLSYSLEGTDAQGNAVDVPTLDESDVLEAVQVPLVPPGAIRRFVLPLRDAPPLTDVAVRIRPASGI